MNIIPDSQGIITAEHFIHLYALCLLGASLCSKVASKSPPAASKKLRRRKRNMGVHQPKNNSSSKKHRVSIWGSRGSRQLQLLFICQTTSMSLRHLGGYKNSFYCIKLLILSSFQIDSSGTLHAFAEEGTGISVMSNNSYEEEFLLEMNKAREGKSKATPWGSGYKKAPEILHGYDKKVKGKTAEERLDLRSGNMRLSYVTPFPWLKLQHSSFALFQSCCSYEK